jgi:hypothetical protein
LGSLPRYYPGPAAAQSGIITIAGGEHQSLAVRLRLTDVGEDHWACEKALACWEAGIVVGCDDGRYHGDWPISRDQMAVFICEAFDSST